MSVESRVESAMEEVQDRLKHLQSTTHGQVHHHTTFTLNSLPPTLCACTQSIVEPSQNTLKPIVMTRQVSHSYRSEEVDVCLLMPYPTITNRRAVHPIPVTVSVSGYYAAMTCSKQCPLFSLLHMRGY